MHSEEGVTTWGFLLLRDRICAVGGFGVVLVLFPSPVLSQQWFLAYLLIISERMGSQYHRYPQVDSNSVPCSLAASEICFPFRRRSCLSFLERDDDEATGRHGRLVATLLGSLMSIADKIDRNISEFRHRR
nr:hypothetical protein CFP56_34875 [Quercus suber]